MTNGEKIRELRKRAGIKGVELAKALGVSSAYLSQVENGARPTSDELLARVLEITGQTLNNLSNGDEQETTHPTSSDSCLARELTEIKQRLNAIETLLVQVLAKLNNK